MAGEKTCAAALWDFSEGGLGMDAPRHFAPGEEIRIEVDLMGPVFSMHLKARARVAYCRCSESRSYRVGVAFLDHSLRRVEA
jgi:Tfp pilus assembly protein PilZ